MSAAMFRPAASAMKKGSGSVFPATGRSLVTIDSAREDLFRCNSYELLPFLFTLLTRGGLSETDFFTLLGEFWSSCDANGRSCGELLYIILPDGAAPEMMTEAERAALAALPESVTIYRGADRGVNEQGFCWSLERDVAARFPFYIRYRATQPVLVTATVDRRHIVAIKLDREEAEVITRRAVLSSVTVLAAAHSLEKGGA